jgi:3D (Asp-Asp-Asp) domain-containing protein
MLHPDLKPLVWGRHLHTFLAALGAGPHRPQPVPRIVGPVPMWFQRVSAVLTLLGLVGALRWVDRAISPAELPGTPAPNTALAASDWKSWTETTLRLPLEALSTKHANHNSAASTAGPGVQDHRFQRIEITAYCAGDPTEVATTASNTTAVPGTIALSRDLLQTFTPDAPFDFGDKVLIPGVGIFEVRDTMAPRWKERADLWFNTQGEARDWGCRTVFVTRVEDSAPTIAYRAP